MELTEAGAAGLFGAYRGFIKRLALTNAQITGLTYVGGIVGDLEGFVSDSYVTGSLSGNFVGGIAGLAWRTGVIDSFSTATLDSTLAAGGITAAQTVIVLRCFGRSDVDGRAGGRCRRQPGRLLLRCHQGMQRL